MKDKTLTKMMQVGWAEAPAGSNVLDPRFKHMEV